MRAVSLMPLIWGWGFFLFLFFMFLKPQSLCGGAALLQSHFDFGELCAYVSCSRRLGPGILTALAGLQLH